VTNQQLYLAIGVPIVVNVLFNGVLIMFLWLHINQRLDDLRDLWRAELKRVEEVIDARLKHLEER
jgi:hypothetical protein